MVICSNREFEQLATSQGGKILAIARDRVKKDPAGSLLDSDMQSYIRTLSYTEPKARVNWLKNLVVLARNGTINRIKHGATGWEDHVEHVHMLYAASQIPLDIGNHVQCKESQRYGTVVDYMPDTQEYVVALDPFQIKTYKKKDIDKVARKLSSKEVNQVRSKNIMYDMAIEDCVKDINTLVARTAAAMGKPEWANDRTHWLWAFGQEVLTDVGE